MTAPSGWICRHCQRQLRPLLERSLRYPTSRRSFVSLQDIPGPKQGETFEPSSKKTNPRLSNRQSKGTATDPEDGQHAVRDEFLENLFKSTGREPPTKPLHLQYSKRYLKFGKHTGEEQRTKEEQCETSTSHSRKSHPTQVQQQDTSDPTYSEDATAEERLLRGEAEGLSTEPLSLFETAKRDVEKHVDDKEQGALEALGTSDDQKSPSDEGIDGVPTLHQLPSRRKSIHREQMSNQSKTSASINYANAPLVSRIRGALKVHDFRMIKNLWKAYRVQLRDGVVTDDWSATRNLTFLLSAFIEARLYDLVTEVWAIITQRAPPTLDQWSIMLEFARKERDRKSLEAIWSSMQAAGILPDNIAWMTYLFGVGRESTRDMMMRLDQLEKQWSTSRDVQQPNLPNPEKFKRSKYDFKPSIMPFNAALECVVLKKQGHYIHQILSRIDRLGLKPIVDTFNILLKRSVSMPDSDMDVSRIIQEMKTHGVEPDEITITTLISATLRDIGAEADPEKAGKRIEEVFSAFDEAGMKPAPHTYTTALDVSLKSNKPNIAAAQAIMKHMDKQDIAPSPHVYTVLLRYYFASDNKAAASALFERAKSREINVDGVFFDRLIEGYAALREFDRMLECLSVMPEVGKPLGWTAARKAIRALANGGYPEQCSMLIQDIETGQGIGTLGIRSQVDAEHQFWTAVEDLRAHGVIPQVDMGR